MAKIVFLGKEIAAMKNAGGAWGDESVGLLGVGLPGTVLHEVYNVRDSIAEKADSTFSLISWAKENWKLCAVGGAALIVLLKK